MELTETKKDWETAEASSWIKLSHGSNAVFNMLKIPIMAYSTNIHKLIYNNHVEEIDF